MSMFSPHGMCFLWHGDMILWHSLSDAVIALAYAIISAALLIFRRYVSTEQILSRWAFASFATFILACGMTHVMDMLVIWNPWYVAQGIVKSVCALASISTAFAVLGLLRKFVGERK